MADKHGDKLLMDFLSFVTDYVPTFPDELVEYYASSAGFQCSDAGVKKLLAVAAQKFVAEIASDAMQFYKLRQGAGASAASKRKIVLTNEDLASALKEYGVQMKRPDYFADSRTAGVAPPAAPPANPPAPAPATGDPDL